MRFIHRRTDQDRPHRRRLGLLGDSMVAAPQLSAARRGSTTWCSTTWPRATMAILALRARAKPELGYADRLRRDRDEAGARRDRAHGHQGLSERGRHPSAGLRRRARCAGREPRACRCASRWSRATTSARAWPNCVPRHAATCSWARPLPEKVLSANAYLGALPIAASAGRGRRRGDHGPLRRQRRSPLGLLMHEFGRQPGDFDRLASGSLAATSSNVGCQATGGLHTDWDEICPTGANIGYLIVECQRRR